MNRRFLLLLATPFLLSAAGPLADAEREAAEALAEQRRLEQAAAVARNAGERAAASREAAAQALLAADARIAASEAALAGLAARRTALERRLASAQRPATALLAALAQAGRQPPLLLLASGSAERQVRLAALVRHVRPEVDRRTAALRDEYRVLAELGARQRQVRDELGSQRLAAAQARDRFAQMEREALRRAEDRGAEAFAAGDRSLAEGERVAGLRGEAARRRAAAALAAQLAKLPPAEPRPGAAEDRSAGAPLDWSMPASGRVTVGLGEVLPNGIRSRGLTIAAGLGTQVSAPAGGRILFAGPFRQRRGLVILDHGQGWMTLLGEVRPSVKVGQRVERGELVGRALGPVTAELFRDGKAEPAALIARSS